MHWRNNWGLPSPRRPWSIAARPRDCTWLLHRSYTSHSRAGVCARDCGIILSALPGLRTWPRPSQWNCFWTFTRAILSRIRGGFNTLRRRRRAKGLSGLLEQPREVLGIDGSVEQIHVPLHSLDGRYCCCSVSSHYYESGLPADLWTDYSLCCIVFSHRTKRNSLLHDNVNAEIPQ